MRRLGVERAGMIVGVMPLATLATAALQAGRLPDPGQSLGVLVVALGLALGLTGRPAPGQDAGPERQADGSEASSAARTASA